MKEANIVDLNEPLSRVTDDMLREGTATIVTKEGRYYGIIDDRNLRTGITDPSKTKCSSVCIKAPHISENASMLEKLNAFLAGHFKAIPILDAREKPKGITTRTDLVEELMKARLVPKVSVKEIMNSPVYSIDYKESIGAVKRVMKENKTHKVLITKDGYPHGIVSTFDLSVESLTAKERDSGEMFSEIEKRDSEPLSHILRDVVATIEDSAMLEDAARKMVERTVSSMIVLKAKKAVGVISATDIFKRISSDSKDKIEIEVSGLDEEQKQYYEMIKERLEHTIEKFRTSIKIGRISLHVKKGKSVYEAKLHIEANGKTTVVSAEDYSFGDAIKKIIDEVNIVLSKKR
ncbi:MAG: CBS domain-containing protein [Candidatus Micrarchaeota archaeon]